MFEFYESIHVYTNDKINVEGRKFLEFSKNWATLVSTTSKNKDEKEARKISRLVDFPVLYFYRYIDVEDGSYIILRLFLKGRTEALFENSCFDRRKNLYKFPRNLGIPEGQIRRFSNILGCWNLDQLVELLEEYFGVCLMIDYDKMDNNCYYRARGDVKYKDFMKEEKRLTGPNKPVALELISEQIGLLLPSVDSDDIACDVSIPNERKKGYYFIGYEREEDEHGNYHPVKFKNGELKPCSIKEWLDQPPFLEEEDQFGDFFTFYNCQNKAFEGKKMKYPVNYYDFGYDQNGYFYFFNEHYNSFLVVNENLEIVAKLRFIGYPWEINGAYLLTESVSQDGIYLENNIIRIYKIVKS